MARHEPHAENRSCDRDGAVGDVADQGGFRREACLRQDLRAIIHDGVDTGNLLADGDTHTDEDDAANPWRCQILVTGLVEVFLGVDAVLDLIELGNGHALIADLLEDLHRIADAALQQEPARALRHHEHAEPEHDGRDRCEGEHVAPDVADLTERDAEDGVEDEGEQLARDDHELVLRDHAAAAVSRCHLCEVRRHGDRSTTDGQAEHEAAGNEDARCRRQRAADGRKEEDHCEAEQHLAAPLGI